MRCRLKRGRAGFTLTELMIVTILIGVLATIAISMFDRVRLDSQVAATKTEMRNVITAIEQYLAVNGTYPASPDDLETDGLHTVSDNIDFCTFEVQADEPPWVLLEAAHRGSTTHVRARYPLTGVQLEEITSDSDCS